MTKVTIDQALIEQAFYMVGTCDWPVPIEKQIPALRAELAEPAKQGQESVTWSNPYQEILESNRIGVEVANKVKRKIHTSPPPPAEPARTSQDVCTVPLLSDDEWKALGYLTEFDRWRAKATEAAVRRKAGL